MRGFPVFKRCVGYPRQILHPRSGDGPCVGKMIVGTDAALSQLETKLEVVLAATFSFDLDLVGGSRQDEELEPVAVTEHAPDRIESGHGRACVNAHGPRRTSRDRGNPDPAAGGRLPRIPQAQAWPIDLPGFIRLECRAGIIPGNEDVGSLQDQRVGEIIIRRWRLAPAATQSQTK